MVTARSSFTLKELPLGAHLVMFYESEEEHRSIVQPYIIDGLRRGEMVLYIYAEHPPEVIEQYLTEAGLDPRSAKKSEQLRFADVRELFREQEEPASDWLIPLLQAEIARVLEAGFTGLRASGEVAWQAEAPDEMGLYTYHQELNEFLPRHKCILLCEYDKRRMHPEAVRQVLLAHPLLLQDHQVIRNPFYGQVMERESEKTGEANRWMECIADLQHIMGSERRAELDFIAAVLDAEGALLIVLDPRARIELFNRACEELTGYAFAEVVGKQFFDLFILPEEQDAVRTVFESLRAGDLPNRFENHWQAKDGSLSLIAWSNTALLDAEGKVEHIIGTGLDVTDLRQLEKAQRESAQRFEVVAQLATDFIYEYDPANNKMTWFGDIDSYLGFPPGEGLNSYEAWMNLIHPEDRERVMAKLAKVRETGESFVDEHRIVKPDGTTLYWLGRAVTIFDETGRPVKFVGAVRDITARKLVDEDLIRSESRFRSLFENAPYGILIHRLGQVILANRALRELIGFPLDADTTGMSLLEYVAPEERERIADYYVRRAAGEDIPSSYETLGRKADGNIIPLWIVVASVELDDGPAMMVFMADITERKAYEEALRNKAEELKNFLTIAAHELRHPITILKGYARVLEDFPDNEMVRDNMPDILGNLDKAANRLDHLVDELLDVSRIEQRKFALEKDSLAVAEVFTRAANEIQIEGLTNPISWAVATGAESVLADADKLDRLLLILLENAANFAAPGSPIQMEAEEQEGEIVISVSDRGSGIPEEARKRVFDRFYQVAEVEYHSVPGLGMGLYIARQIVDAHGGRIWNEPREGGGTVFRFSLPIA